VQQRNMRGKRVAGLDKQMHKGDAVFSAAEHEHRIIELCYSLTQDIDGFIF
jgi:hypothetical protein